MIWERVGDIFYTVEVCYDLLSKTIPNKGRTEAKTEITAKAPLGGKNDFENMLNNLGVNEQGTVPRELNLRRNSKFNGVPMSNPQMAQMMVGMRSMRKGNRKMTYDYSNVNFNMNRNWNYNNQSNYYNKNQYSNKGYNNYHHRSFANQSNNVRNNYRRYTINPELSNVNAINELKEEKHNNDKKEIKVIDITDTLFA